MKEKLFETIHYANEPYKIIEQLFPKAKTIALCSIYSEAGWRFCLYGYFFLFLYET